MGNLTFGVEEWKPTNCWFGKKRMKNPTLKDHGKLVTEPQKKAKMLNDKFDKAFGYGKKV